MSQRQTTSVGITTTGTILAVGVSAAYAALATAPQKTIHAISDIPFLYLIAPAAIISLALYALTLALSISVIHEQSEAVRNKELRRTTMALFVQGSSATSFALITIFGTLLTTTDTTPSRDNKQELFTYAQDLQSQAEGLLNQGNTQAAAETSWQAAKVATDALILTRTGNTPSTQAKTTNLLEALSQRQSGVEKLIDPYYQRLSQLHYTCFLDNKCNPDHEQLIFETSEYIASAEQLAQQ